MARWKQILTSSINDESDELVTNPASKSIIFTFADCDGLPSVT